jgi:MoaA/NifB/PqqE/SkfB family radical SAM enzyme
MRFGTLKRELNVFLMLLYARIFRKRIPVRVALQVTNYCNMRCSYCYVNFDTYKRIPDWSREKLFQTIDELYSYGTRWIWFLGGEPMARADFGETVDYATKKGIFCDMNSNGTLINQENIETVKKLDAVCISIDGDEESNDYYRGRGSYQKAIKAVKLLKRHNVKVRLHAILTKKTFKKLDHMVNLSQKLGVTFNFCEVLKSHPNLDDHILSTHEADEFYKKYLEYKRRGYPIVYSSYGIKRTMNWPKKDGSVLYSDEASLYPRDSYIPCLSGDLQCFYDVDGRIYACNGTWEEGLNAHEVGFKKAWDYLADRKCIACKCMGMSELHLLLGLNSRFIIHGLKQALGITH